MPKSNRIIRPNDRKILDLLSVNARQSLIEISEKTGLSRQTVQKSISRLEKDQVIWGHKSIVDLRRIGKKIFIILIKSNPNLTKEKAIEIIPVASKAMDKTPGFKTIYSGFVHGVFNWVLILAADDVIQVSKLMRTWESKYSDYVKDFQILEEMMPVRFCGFINPHYKEELSKIL